jgi:hypothetical protein
MRLLPETEEKLSSFDGLSDGDTKSCLEFPPILNIMCLTLCN